MADDQYGPDIFSDAPPAGPEAEKPDYKDMPWSQVGGMAVKNLIPSAVNSVTAIPKAIYNYPETLSAIGQIGTGLYSKAEGLVTDQNPEEKAKAEAVVNSLAEPYTSVEGFKKTLAEDPFSIVSTAAIPLTAGSVGLAKGAELVGKAGTIGRALNTASKVAGTTAKLMDPTQAVVEGLKFAGRNVSHIQGLTTGKPGYVFDKAYEAGKSNDGRIKSAFERYYTGNGDPVELADDTKKAIDAIRDKEISEWLGDKANLTAASQTPVPEQKILDAVQKANDELVLPNNPVLFQEAKAAMAEVEKKLMHHLTQPAGSVERSVLGMDQLKRDLYEMAQAERNPTARNAILGVYHGVLDTLHDASPEYAALMDRYKNIKSQLGDITAVTGAGGRANATTQLGRLIRSTKTANGQNLLERLAEVDPTIPYKIAGESLQGSIPSGILPKAAELGTGLAFHAPNIYRALQTGSPIEIAKALALPAAQAVVQSPAAMGSVSYNAGRLGRGVAPVAQAADKAIEAGGSAAATNLERTKRDTFADPSMFSDKPPEKREPLEIGIPLKPQVPTGEASGGRIGRKAGGKVTGNALSREVEKTRKELSHKTAQMLSMPDDAIVTALRIAKD